MDYMLEQYCQNIISVVERQRNEVRCKVYSSNIFCILYRKKYEELLDKYDLLLMHCYEFLGNMLEKM